MARVQHSSEALDAFARRHVCYEVWAACNGVARWYLSRGIVAQGVASQLLLAQLVHLRALDSFLISNPIKDDVVATDYAPGWPGTSYLTQDERSAINSQVAHLSMGRNRAPIWDPVELTAGVLHGFSDFLDDCPDRAGPDGVFTSANSVLGQFEAWYDLLDTLKDGNPPEELRTEDPPDLNLGVFHFTWPTTEGHGS